MTPTTDAPSPVTGDLSLWPDRRRRHPRLGTSSYVIERGIVRSLKRARDHYLGDGLRVLDAGSRVMPYYPLFASRAIEYVGNDLEPGPRILYVSPVEELNAPDAHFDLVLCTQVLEHVRRPQQALEQMARVLVPGGYLFLTTHGVYPFHPDPRDYWRWTQQGFEAMFEDVPALELVELVPHNGAASTLTTLAATGVRELARALHVGFLGVPLIATLNLLGLAGDRLLPHTARERLVCTFLAVARRRSESAERAQLTNSFRSRSSVSSGKRSA